MSALQNRACAFHCLFLLPLLALLACSPLQMCQARWVWKTCSCFTAYQGPRALGFTAFSGDRSQAGLLQQLRAGCCSWGCARVVCCHQPCPALFLLPGRLGLGTLDCHNSPQQVTVPPEHEAQRVICGIDSSMVLTVKNQVLACGSNR